MTIVNIDLKDISHSTGPLDTVIFYSPVYREKNDGGMVSTRENHVRLDNGLGSVNLVPGPVMVKFQAQGVADFSIKHGNVPETGPATLADVIEADLVYSPPVVSIVVQARNEALEAKEDAVTAKNSAEQAADRVGTAEQVGTWASEAEDAATRAENATALKADLVGGKVPSSQIPEIALTKPSSVTTRNQMLALPAQEGDIAIITAGADKGTYILGSGKSSQFASWMLMAVTPAVPVQSVNGQIGNVTLGYADVGAAPVSHNHDPAADINGWVPYSTTIFQANTVPTRATGGFLMVPSNPVNPNAATSKDYVDARTPAIQIVSALPSSLTAGTMYVVTG